MIYLFLFVAIGLGVGYHIMQKITSLKRKFPALKFWDVWQTFFNEEWDSILVSALVLATCEFALVIVNYNGVALPYWLEAWGMYVIGAVLGYSGQRLAYKYLGTAEQVLEKKAEQLNKL